MEFSLCDYLNVTYVLLWSALWGSTSGVTTQTISLYQTIQWPWYVTPPLLINSCLLVVFLFRRTLTRELMWHESIFHTALAYGICLLINLCERDTVHLLMFSAKQGNYWYHFYNMTRSLTVDWSRDLPHSKRTFYRKTIKEVWSSFIFCCFLYIGLKGDSYSFSHLRYLVQ